MRSAIRLFLVLITIIVILFAWITDQLGRSQIQLLIIVLIITSVAAFLVMNLLDHREQRMKREKRESRSTTRPPPDQQIHKRSDTSYALREQKSGLSWGGGNIKASEATRGTKRKFLRR